MIRDRFFSVSTSLRSWYSSPARCHHPYNRYFSTTPRLNKKRMAPKKAPQQEKKVILGRPSNNLKIGIVGMGFLVNVFLTRPDHFCTGLPNVGKSSFFNALSDTGACSRSHYSSTIWPYQSFQILGKLQISPTQQSSKWGPQNYLYFNATQADQNFDSPEVRICCMLFLQDL